MGSPQTLSSKAAKSTLWSAIDRFGTVIMQFVINMVLARLLTPDDFGIVGMIIIIVAVSSILTDGGFGAALIQRDNPSEVDYATASYANVATSLILYAAIYITAGDIASFLETPQLESILRIISVVIIINSIGLVPKTKLRRTLAFKQIAIANIVAYALAAAAAILLAHRGFGVWSLVAMHIINALFANLFICIAAGWRPSASFSTKSFKELFSYGEYMLITDIMSNICFHIQSTLIGKYFTPYTAGQYAQAKKMEEVAAITLPSAMNQVLFPLYSRTQDNRQELLRLLRLNTKMIAFVIFPIMTILIVVAKPLILLLFGQNWIDSVLYFQVLCLGGVWGSLQYFNYYAIAAIGKSKVLFYAGLIKGGLLIASILICVHINMYAVLIAIVLSNVANYFTNAIIAQRYIGYAVSRQMLDVLPMLLSALLLGGIAYIALNIWGIDWVVVALLYATAYLATCYITKQEAIRLIKREIMRRFAKEIK
jgi:O-antigen/teichoic acid export membrane protein